MKLVASIIAVTVGCLAFGEGATIIVLPRASSFVQEGSDYKYTSEDLSAGLLVISQDESLYLSLLAGDLAEWEALLSSRTLSAFQVSSTAGNCALSIQRSAVASLTSVANAAREQLISNHSAARKLLTEAKTEQEMTAAWEYITKEKVQSSTYFAKVVQELASSFVTGLQGIEKCMS